MKKTEINKNNLNNIAEERQENKSTDTSEKTEKSISKVTRDNKKVVSEHYRSFRRRWGSSKLL